MEVQPLTRCNSSGVPYQRLPAVTAQIERALGLSTDNLLEHARMSDSCSPLYLQEESLVYLIRHFRRGGHEALVNDLSEVLYGRTAKWAKSRLRVLSPDNLEDGIHNVISGVFEKILDLDSDRGDFFQVKFWLALKRITISTYKSEKKQYEKDVETEAATASLPRDDDDEPVNCTDNPWEAIPDQQLLPEQKVLVSEGISSVSEPYQTAYILHNLMRFQVESLDPNEPTVSTMLGKTSRTIRNWLAKAEEQLENWRNSL